MQLEDYFDFQRSVLWPCSHSQVSRDTGLRVLLVVPAAHQENPAPNQCEISSGNLPRSNHRSSALVSISFSLVANDRPFYADNTCSAVKASSGKV